MPEDDFTNARDIEELLARMGATTRTQTLTPLEETKQALRREWAEYTDKIYANTLKSVEGELQYSTSRHLIAGMFGFLGDAIYTLWDPAKEIIESPFVAEEVRKTVGPGKTIVDYITSKKNQREPGQKEQNAQEIKKMLNTFTRLESYAKTITDYCQETGKTPDAVLHSSRDMLGIIEKVYGSVEEYEKSEVKSVNNLTKLVDHLNVIGHMPLGLMIPDLITSHVESVKDLSDVGINPAMIGTIVQSYVGDVAKFAKAFIIEYAKLKATEIIEYKTLAQAN